MDVQEIIKQLTAKFGAGSFDISKVTEALKGFDFKDMHITDIITKLGAQGLLKNISLDSAKEGLMDSVKDKVGGMLGGMFGK